MCSSNGANLIRGWLIRMKGNSAMKAQIITLILMLTTCIAMIVFCTVGLTLMLSWMPASISHSYSNITTSGIEMLLDNDFIQQGDEREMVELPRPITAQFLINYQWSVPYKLQKNARLRTIYFEYANIR